MIRSLIRDLIDYAGLFPPAALSMQAAADKYAGYKTGAHSFALGRFVVPVARLEELQAALPKEQEYPWTISALLSGNLESDLAVIDSFNQSQRGKANIDSVEMRVQSAQQIEGASKLLPEDLLAHFEIPIVDDPAPLISTIAENHRRAKIRTGGVTVDAFPQPAEIIRFLDLCARANVPFKATAGLHHPMYCYRPLTYSADAPQGWMFGFLNLFLAAAWIRLGMDPKAIAPLLEEQDPAALRLGAGEIDWRVFRLTGAQVEDVRNRFALSFDSCSFEEPIADLEALGFLQDSSW